MALKDMLPWTCSKCGKKVNARNSACGFCLTKRK